MPGFRRKSATMTPDDIIRRLAEGRHVWEPFHVAALYVFGPVARGDARAESDIDVLVDLTEPISLFEFARLRRALAEHLGREVDLVTRAALRPETRDAILREAVRAA